MTRAFFYEVIPLCSCSALTGWLGDFMVRPLVQRGKECDVHPGLVWYMIPGGVKYQRLFHFPSGGAVRPRFLPVYGVSRHACRAVIPFSESQ